jgi:ribosomal protein S18 acetylase RimI-like enzyme
MPLRLSVVQPGDEEASRRVAEIDDLLFPENSFGSHTWSVESHHDLILLLADDTEEPCGLVVVRPDGYYNDIIRFGVSPALQGRGVADHLMLLTLSLLRGPVGLYVRQENHRAQRFYRRHGFHTHGIVYSDLGCYWAMIRS